MTHKKFILIIFFALLSFSNLSFTMDVLELPPSLMKNITTRLSSQDQGKLALSCPHFREMAGLEAEERLLSPLTQGREDLEFLHILKTCSTTAKQLDQETPNRDFYEKLHAKRQQVARELSRNQHPVALIIGALWGESDPQDQIITWIEKGKYLQRAPHLRAAILFRLASRGHRKAQALLENWVEDFVKASSTLPLPEEAKHEAVLTLAKISFSAPGSVSNQAQENILSAIQKGKCGLTPFEQRHIIEGFVNQKSESALRLLLEGYEKGCFGFQQQSLERLRQAVEFYAENSRSLEATRLYLEGLGQGRHGFQRNIARYQETLFRYATDDTHPHQKTFLNWLYSYLRGSYKTEEFIHFGFQAVYRLMQRGEERALEEVFPNTPSAHWQDREGKLRLLEKVDPQLQIAFVKELIKFKGQTALSLVFSALQHNHYNTRGVLTLAEQQDFILGNLDQGYTTAPLALQGIQENLFGFELWSAEERANLLIRLALKNKFGPAQRFTLELIEQEKCPLPLERQQEFISAMMSGLYLSHPSWIELKLKAHQLALKGYALGKFGFPQSEHAHQDLLLKIRELQAEIRQQEENSLSY